MKSHISARAEKRVSIHKSLDHAGKGRGHTEIEDRLVGSDAENAPLDLLAGSAETHNLIDGNAVRSGSGDEGGTVAELGHAVGAFHARP